MLKKSFEKQQKKGKNSWATIAQNAENRYANIVQKLQKIICYNCTKRIFSKAAQHKSFGMKK